MKKLFLIFFLSAIRVAAFACDACKKQQPKILQNITHGTGPQNNWDYVIVWVAVVVVLFTLFFSVKWLIRPGEKSDNHIKRFILTNE